MYPFLVAAAVTVLNPSSSFERNISIETCRHAEVKKACAFDIEAPGYGSRKFKVYKKDTNGDLITLQEGVIDASGLKKLQFKFDSVETVNLIIILFNLKGEPVAIDGAFINVEPDKNQLGEQYVPNLYIEVILPVGSESSDQEEDYEISSD